MNKWHRIRSCQFLCRFYRRDWRAVHRPHPSALDEIHPRRLDQSRPCRPSQRRPRLPPCPPVGAIRFDSPLRLQKAPHTSLGGRVPDGRAGDSPRNVLATICRPIALPAYRVSKPRLESNRQGDATNSFQESDSRARIDASNGIAIGLPPAAHSSQPIQLPTQ